MCVSNRECYLKTTCGCVVVLVLSAHYEKEEDHCNAWLEVLVPGERTRKVWPYPRLAQSRGYSKATEGYTAAQYWDR